LKQNLSSGNTILYGVTIPLSARSFFVGQLNLLAHSGLDVHLVYGNDGSGRIAEFDARIDQIPIPVLRRPSPLRDLRALRQLVLLVYRIRPSTTVMTTPKMGLLGTLAARICGVPRRVYILMGLRLEGATGAKRRFLWIMEWLAMACATEVLSVSESNRTEAVRLNLVSREKIHVIGKGGIRGVDSTRFCIPSEEQRAAARGRFGLPLDVPVLGFVGRLAPDKGLTLLPEVWRQVHKQKPDAWMLVVGPDDTSGLGVGDQVTRLKGLPNVVVHGPVTDPESAFQALDLLILLTKREGFGMVLVEAAACGVPAVATRVSGTVDAVVDGETATLVPLGDVEAATAAVLEYINTPARLREHGYQGRQRVCRDFAPDDVDIHWAMHIAGKPLLTSRKKGSDDIR
jgi:glycosyltransferase involved in cell wall biosynthesis